jgi:antitoxin component YwqK of YwqJK toxin-antitoxin module
MNRDTAFAASFFPTFDHMNRILTFSLLFLMICLLACSAHKPGPAQILSQDKFQYTKTADSTFSLKVNFYDQVSDYDSPYQQFMLNNDDKPDGKFVVTDENDHTRRVLHYKKHKREGMDTWYYADGQIMQQKLFVNNQFVSYKSYYPNRRMTDTELTDTLGFKRHWDEDGHLVYEKNYRTGEFKHWYSDGKLQIKGQECPKECFTYQGPWYFYTETEKLDQIIFYHGSPDADAWDSIYHYDGDRVAYTERK